jgi:hypothetical protein
MAADDLPALPTSWASPIRPGDTLIVGFTGHITMAEADRVRDRLSELAPDVTVVVMDNVAALAVYRRGAA